LGGAGRLEELQALNGGVDLAAEQGKFKVPTLLSFEQEVKLVNFMKTLSDR